MRHFQLLLLLGSLTLGGACVAAETPPMTANLPAAGGYMQPGNPDRGIPNAAPVRKPPRCTAAKARAHKCRPARKPVAARHD